MSPKERFRLNLSRIYFFFLLLIFFSGSMQEYNYFFLYVEYIFFCISLELLFYPFTHMLVCFSGFFSYSASLHSLPDLPKWIHMTYSHKFNMGFLYGTPPPDLESTIKVFRLLILYSKIIKCDSHHLFFQVGSNSFKPAHI